MRYGSPQHFVDGMNPAVYVGAAIVAVGSLLGFAIGRRRRVAEEALETPALAEAA